jgi:PknH-like extracellular domain
MTDGLVGRDAGGSHAATRGGGMRRSPWMLVGARLVLVAAAGLCLMLTGCTQSVTGRLAAAPDLGRWQAPPILTPRLAGLLLDPDQLTSLVHGTRMTLRAPIEEMSRSTVVLSDPECLSAYTPIQATVYQRTNWMAVQGQVLDDAASASDPGNNALLQAVVAFRDATSAQQFFGQAKSQWSGCANRPLTVFRPGHAAATYDFGTLAATDTSLSVTQTLKGDRFACQRVMGLANNVIIDTLWCGTDTAEQAGQIVAKIADAISQA